MENKILTISIAAYNVEHCLGKCLDSFIECGNFAKLQILVENDGSKDGTKLLAEKYEKKYPNSIEVINKKNGGHGSTINESIKRAVGKYFKVVDADDWIESAGLDKLIEYLEENEVDLVLNPYYEVDALNGNKKCVTPWNEGSLFESVCNLNDIKVDEISLAMHAMTFSTKVIKKMGPCIDENCFYVDVEYSLFPLTYVETVKCLNYEIYDYLLGTETQSMNMNNLVSRRKQHLKVCKSVIEFYENNKGIFIGNQGGIIKKRVCAIVCLQYIILLKIDKLGEKKELLEFDGFLRDRSKELYKESIEYGASNKSGYINVMQRMREKNFNNFIIWYFILKIYSKFK